MSLYPDLPGPRARVLARDLLGAAALIVFAWLGIRVYHDVNKLSSLGIGVADAGMSLKSALSSAAASAANVPLAGSTLAHGLRDAAGATGGNIETVGRDGARSAHHLAVVLGLVAWALPSALLLVLILPRRLAEARDLRRMRAAAGSQKEEEMRLLAVRAVLTLPNETLFSRTPDPGGDLLAGRYDALAAAEREANGVKTLPSTAGTRKR